MIYKGTDKDAFKRASKGLTAKSRSRKYRKYKAQNEKKRERGGLAVFAKTKLHAEYPQTAKGKVINGTSNSA